MEKDQEQKMEEKLTEYEEIIKTIEDPDILSSFENSSRKKDKDYAKKVKNINKSQEIEIRRKIEKFNEIKKWEKMLTNLPNFEKGRPFKKRTN